MPCSAASCTMPTVSGKLHSLNFLGLHVPQATQVGKSLDLTEATRQKKYCYSHDKDEERVQKQPEPGKVGLLLLKRQCALWGGKSTHRGHLVCRQGVGGVLRCMEPEAVLPRPPQGAAGQNGVSQVLMRDYVETSF